MPNFGLKMQRISNQTDWQLIVVYFRVSLSGGVEEAELGTT
jgi:hypothetical protein